MPQLSDYITNPNLAAELTRLAEKRDKAIDDAITIIQMMKDCVVDEESQIVSVNDELAIALVKVAAGYNVAIDKVWSKALANVEVDWDRLHQIEEVG